MKTVKGKRRRVARRRPKPLSVRERQCLAGISVGFRSAEIAVLTGMSEHTVKTHLSRTYRKLGARGGANAVAVGFRRGLLT